MSINTRTGLTDTAVRTGIAARLAEIQARADRATEGWWDVDGDGWIITRHGRIVACAESHNDPETVPEVIWLNDNDKAVVRAARTDVPALTLAVESVLIYADRCEQSGITMQPGDIHRLIAAALGGAS